jgi:hypothetical protein
LQRKTRALIVATSAITIFSLPKHFSRRTWFSPLTEYHIKGVAVAKKGKIGVSLETI